jgi:cyclopropane-fatty-acyl-phospholipid synthase
MATQQEMEATYNYMDEIFRLSLGETGDLSCAMYKGDFSKTLAHKGRSPAQSRPGVL